MRSNAVRKVYIPNNKNYDLQDAHRFGEVKVISEGLINVFDIEEMNRLIKGALVDASQDDYVAMVGYPIINVLAALTMMSKFGHVNFLIFDIKEKR